MMISSQPSITPYFHYRHNRSDSETAENINRPVPHAPDYQCKYTHGVHHQLHNDPVLQTKQAFIDPHTGTIYESYNRNKPDVLSGGDKTMATYKRQNLNDNHIYNTLEPLTNDLT